MLTMPQTLQLPNGDKVRPTFSQAELQSRLDKLRCYMAENDVQAVLFTSYHNINYYSDFVYCRFGRDYGLAITQDSYTTITANIDGGQPYRRNQLGDNVIYTDWQKDNFFHAVKQLIKDGGRVGIEHDHMPLQNLQKMKDALPGAEFVDIGVPTMKMRMIKSEEEIALIKQGARVADVGGAAIRDAIAVGVPEYEIALAGTQAMVREIAGL